jgi:peptidylprolyl isomerase
MEARMRVFVALALMVSACAAPAPAPAEEQPYAGPPMQDILDASPASDWRALPQDNLLYMMLPSGRVIIELTSTFAPEHTANVRALAAAHYWDGGAITRVQENYVVQWAGPSGLDAPLGNARGEIVTPEYDRPAGDLPFTQLRDLDTYAVQVGFTEGFPAGRDGRGLTWPLHCYGMIGVGRELPPNTGNGTELYVVLGQAPRHLDRNLAIVGRVVQGMELLSSLKRGTGDLGFYETLAEHTSIRSARLGSELPADQQVQLEALRTDSASFASLVEARRWRTEDFFVEPTGRINVCNVPLPVRPAQG